MSVRVLIPFFLFFTIMTNNAFSYAIDYAFSGELTSMFEHDNSTGINTNVSMSNMFGFEMSVGENFSGFFSYESETPESWYRSAYPEKNTAVFQYATNSFIFKTDNYYYNDITPNGSLDSIVLWNDKTSGIKDNFSIQSSNPLIDIYSNASLGFYDDTGLALDDFLIPLTLNLQDFRGYAYFHSSLLDRNTGNQLHFYGKATEIIATPEPSTYLLTITGLASLLVFRKRL